METIIFVLILAFIVYVVMAAQKQITEYQTINEHLDPHKAFLHLKSKIIRTSAYTEEYTYILLYQKIKTMACEFIGKHSSVLATQEILAEIDDSFETYFEMEKNRYRIKRTLNIEDVSSKILLALAITSFLGERNKGGMEISVNKFFCNRTIEYLIEERHFWPAQLGKALILKYGFEPYLAPSVDTSARLFQELASTYSPAYDELEDIDLFRQLENIKSVHPSAGARADWESHTMINQRLKVYHPLNING